MCIRVENVSNLQFKKQSMQRVINLYASAHSVIGRIRNNITGITEYKELHT